MRDVVVIPTYNERENITHLISRILTYQPNLHVIVVDDNSPDGTSDMVNSFTSNDRNKNVFLFSRKKKEGLGAAYKDILSKLAQESSVEHIITMDADGSHDPLILESFLRELEKYDLVIGSRYVPQARIENWSFFRRLLSRFANIYSKILTGLPINDLTAGFVGFKRTMLEKINLNNISSTGYAYQIDFKDRSLKANAAFCEIPIIFREREKGHSKITFSIILEGIIVPIKLGIRRIF